MIEKTKEEIQAEIKKLKVVKPNVVEFTYFGESNHDAIDAQIDVLENGWDEDDVYEIYEDDEGNLGYNGGAAQIAAIWVSGDSEEESLADGWPLKE